MFAEIPVHPESAPYMVTSNKRGFLWIERCFNTGVVRSALLPTPWESVAEATQTVICLELRRQGLERGWGNVFPFDDQGIASAKDYLKSYGFEDTVLLSHQEFPWVPDKSAVVVPRDRAYLGIVATWGDSVHTVVLHNPSRGVAILGDWEGPWSHPSVTG
jgi:hypothetical protein